MAGETVKCPKDHDEGLLQLLAGIVGGVQIPVCEQLLHHLRQAGPRSSTLVWHCATSFVRLIMHTRVALRNTLACWQRLPTHRWSSELSPRLTPSFSRVFDVPLNTRSRSPVAFSFSTRPSFCKMLGPAAAVHGTPCTQQMLLVGQRLHESMDGAWRAHKPATALCVHHCRKRAAHILGPGTGVLMSECCASELPLSECGLHVSARRGVHVHCGLLWVHGGASVGDQRK